MIDRLAREQLVAAMERYLSGQTRSRAFEREISEFCGRMHAGDPVARFVANNLLEFVDEFSDSPAPACKEAWDYMERVRLLLQSDVVGIRGDKEGLGSTGSRLIFAVLLIGATCLLLSNPVFPVLVLPPLILISFVWAAFRRSEPRFAQRTAPFASWAELARARRRTASFRKRPCPPQYRIESSRRTGIMETVGMGLIALPSAPLMLIFGDMDSDDVATFEWPD